MTEFDIAAATKRDAAPDMDCHSVLNNLADEAYCENEAYFYYAAK